MTEENGCGKPQLLPNPERLKNHLGNLTSMCGIFAYMGHKPLSVLEVLKVLHILENEQELGEKSPVGGHGAGLAYLNQKDTVTLTKVGKTNANSPVNNLQRQLGKTANNSSRLILGHVRRASPEFQNTIAYKECTQPYQPDCTHSHDFTVLTAHNGKAQNYQQLKNKLNQPHQFESQRRHVLIDSEVIAHLTEELLTQAKHTTRTTHTLFEQTQGNNTIVTVCINKNQAHLHTIQKGKTRGLTAWTNPKGEALICSREQPTAKIFNKFLTDNNLQKTISVSRKDPVNLEAHFNLKL